MSLISELKNTSVRFEAKGSSVVFKNIFYCFGDDGEEDLVESPIAIAIGVGGNYGEVWSKEEVAKLLADLLNKELGLL